MFRRRKKREISFKIEILIEGDQDRFHAYCPSLKGMHIDGNTEKEALENAKNAIILYIESLVKHGDPIPLDVFDIESFRDSISTKVDCSPQQRYTENVLVAI